MAHAYVKKIRKHLVDEDIIITNGIMQIEDIVYLEDEELFGTIIIDSDFINKKFFENNEHSKEEVFAMLVEFCQEYISDDTQVFKII